MEYFRTHISPRWIRVCTFRQVVHDIIRHANGPLQEDFSCNAQHSLTAMLLIQEQLGCVSCRLVRVPFIRIPSHKIAYSERSLESCIRPLEEFRNVVSSFVLSTYLLQQQMLKKGAPITFSFILLLFTSLRLRPCHVMPVTDALDQSLMPLMALQLSCLQ